MRADIYRAELVRLQKETASLHADLVRHEETATKARAEAGRRRLAATQTRSQATMQTHLRTAESEDRKVVAAEKKVGDLRAKAASVADRARRAQANLDRALKDERAAVERDDAARRRKEKAERDAREREDDRRRRTELEHARRLSGLSTVTVRHVLARTPEPEKLRVLYLTASPVGIDALRVDAEVNNVLKALRGAKHRELVELLHRPAATPQDLMDGINDYRPHVVHFSGHGGSDGLLFDDASLEKPASQIIDFLALARLLSATNAPPTVVVLNACETTASAEPLLEVVPVVIAMSEPVGDMAAGLFATHFYAAIAGAQSVGHAVAQAKTMVSIALPDEPDVVELLAGPEVEVGDLFLVRPVPNEK